MVFGQDIEFYVKTHELVYCNIVSSACHCLRVHPLRNNYKYPTHLTLGHYNFLNFVQCDVNSEAILLYASCCNTKHYYNLVVISVVGAAL